MIVVTLGCTESGSGVTFDEDDILTTSAGGVFAVAVDDSGDVLIKGY